MYSTYQAASLQNQRQQGQIGGYLADTSTSVFIHDFLCGFDFTRDTIFAPLVLKTVLVFESYLNGRRSSFAIVDIFFKTSGEFRFGRY